MPYLISPTALNDLESIWHFIAEGSNDQKASEFQETFFEAMARLAEIPGMGSFHTDFTDRPVRFWAVGRYWLIYRNLTDTPDTIEVVRVLAQERNIPGILS